MFITCRYLAQEKTKRRKKKATQRPLPRISKGSNKIPRPFISEGKTKKNNVKMATAKRKTDSTHGVEKHMEQGSLGGIHLSTKRSDYSRSPQKKGKRGKCHGKTGESAANSKLIERRSRDDSYHTAHRGTFSYRTDGGIGEQFPRMLLPRLRGSIFLEVIFLRERSEKTPSYFPFRLTKEVL